MKPQVVIGLNAVIVAVTEDTPRILTVQKTREAWSELSGRKGPEPAGHSVEALPFGPFDPASDRTLELGLRRWVLQHTGLELGYVEQLYTFGNRNRDPLELRGGPRVISVAYLALVRERLLAGTGAANWRDCYRFLPWEDWREGKPPILEKTIQTAVERWIRDSPPAARQERRERSDIHFGLHGAPWVPERVLDRYELLYEIGLPEESTLDPERAPGASQGGTRPARITDAIGQRMGLDHRRILASALGRLRGKLKYRPVVFELLPSSFTLFQLQKVVEALSGKRLHKQNLRRLVESGGLVEGTGKLDSGTGGRPAELFRFRRDVLRERPAPGVGIPEHRHF
jgi:hypothetical protein